MQLGKSGAVISPTDAAKQVAGLAPTHQDVNELNSFTKSIHNNKEVNLWTRGITYYVKTTNWKQTVTVMYEFSLGTRPFTVRRKGLGTCPHLSCPYGMQLCMVISDLWWHHTHIYCQSAHCSTQVLRRNTKHHSKFAIPSCWQHWKPGENHFHDVICNQQFWLSRSTFHPGVNIPSWGQNECRRVPRPFLLLRRVWFQGEDWCWD